MIHTALCVYHCCPIPLFILYITHLHVCLLHVLMCVSFEFCSPFLYTKHTKQEGCLFYKQARDNDSKLGRLLTPASSDMLSRQECLTSCCGCCCSTCLRNRLGCNYCCIGWRCRSNMSRKACLSGCNVALCDCCNGNISLETLLKLTDNSQNQSFHDHSNDQVTIEKDLMKSWVNEIVSRSLIWDLGVH